MRNASLTALLSLLLVLPLTGRAAVLITSSEAKLPAADDGDRGSVGRSPDLTVSMPSSRTVSPFAVRVRFEPHNGAKIDPGDVKVTLMTVPRVDLTDRVRPYISGTGIDFPRAEAPPGNYRIRVSLEDSAGHRAATMVQVMVAPR